MNLETNRTLRHEGAHQLFHNYGVRSAHDAENLWLVEGLAVYCENERIGYRPSYDFDLLREAASVKHPIPFPQLVNFRSSRGFGGLGSGKRVSLAYAQSWLVVDFAMRQEHRERFFDYIRYVRDRRNHDVLAQQSRFDILSQFLEVPPLAELEQALLDEMRRL